MALSLKGQPLGPREMRKPGEPPQNAPIKTMPTKADATLPKWRRRSPAWKWGSKSS